MTDISEQPARRDGVASRFQIDDIREAGAKALESAAEKERLSTPELVREIWETVTALRAAGRTVDHIARWLIEQGVQAAPSTIASAIQKESTMRRRPGARSKRSNSAPKPASVRKTSVRGGASEPSPSTVVPVRTGSTDARRRSAAFDDDSV